MITNDKEKQRLTIVVRLSRVEHQVRMSGRKVGTQPDMTRIYESGNTCIHVTCVTGTEEGMGKGMKMTRVKVWDHMQIKSVA